MATSAFVFDATTDSFATSVVEQSHTVPVLVDFWATWCGPCRALGPILEKLAEQYAGGFVLAKVDTDRESALAAQFQIRSIPTVMLFKDGKSVAGFPGALPEGKVRQFLTEHGVQPGGETLVLAEDPLERVLQLRAALAADRTNPARQLDLAVGLLDTQEYGEAGIMLEALPPAHYHEARAVRARARLALHRMVTGAPTREELAMRVAARDDDTESILHLGIRELLEGDAASGFAHLLTVLRAQRGDEHSSARTTLVEAFQCIEDEALVRDTRRQMAAVLF